MKTIKQWAASVARKGNTAKGENFERQVEKFLIQRGYLCDVTKMNRRMIYRSGRAAWITQKADFFGCIDIIAVGLGKSPMIFVQCTTSKNLVKTKQREIEQVFGQRGLAQRFEIWIPGVAVNDFRVWRMASSPPYGRKIWLEFPSAAEVYLFDDGWEPKSDAN